jgi:hypothetical protein
MSVMTTATFAFGTGFMINEVNEDERKADPFGAWNYRYCQADLTEKFAPQTLPQFGGCLTVAELGHMRPLHVTKIHHHNGFQWAR